MNRHCYRIIFNRARRMLVVVSELARARGGDTGRGPGGGSSCVATLRPLTLALWLAGGIVSTGAQAETIAADRSAPGGQQPTVMQTGNGLPQVNIQTPNDKGLSHNKYSQFDVGERGAILNNSQHNTQTQLAGQVAGNPWLAKGSARVILNEVNSMNPSQLRGFIEVAGKKADVIIANPAGITCSGCGFINAGHNTLAAGRVRLENGQIAGYDVDRGRITISGRGMNGTGQDYTRLIARAVDVNARLQAGDLKITTGHNQTDADGNVIKVKADDPDGRPQFAVDTASLGGMYANRITLVGTERGVGVRNAGEIGATQGGFTLNSEGKLTNSGTVYAQQDLALKTTRLENQGHITSGSNLKITNQGELTNGGRISAGQDLQLETSGMLRSQAGSALVAGRNTHINAQSLQAEAGSAMGAGIDSNGQATQSGLLAVNTAGRLESHGTHLSRDGVTASGSEVDLSGSQTRTAGITATAREGNLSVDGALIDAQQATLSTTRVLSSRNSAVAADQLTLRADSIDNSGGLLISRGGQTFTLNSKSIDNSHGTLIGSQLSIHADKLINRQGTLEGLQSVAIDAGSLDSQQGVISARSGDATLNITGDIDNRGGNLQAQNLTLNAGNIYNQSGFIGASDTLNLKGTSLINDSGLLSADGGAAALSLSGALTNRQGTLQSQQAMSLDAASLDNDNGKILSARAQVDGRFSGALSNQAGHILAGSGLSLNSGSLANQQGVIAATQGDNRLTTGVLNNQGGDIEASRQLLIHGGALDNSGGHLLAGNLMQVVSDALTNFNGLMQSGDALSIDTRTGALDNRNTLSDSTGIRAGGLLTLNAGDVDNRGGLILGDTIQASGLAWNNQGGELDSQRDLTLSGVSLLNQQGLLNGGDGSVTVSLLNALSNQHGTLQSSQHLNVSAGELDNSNGALLAAAGNARVSVQNTFNNQQGRLLARNDVHLSAGDVNNQEGRVSALNGSGFIGAISGILNTGGIIDAVSALVLKGSLLENSGGQIVASGGALNASAGSVSNQAGRMAAQGDLLIDGQTLDNSHGTLTSVEGELRARLEKAISNLNGVIQSGHAVTLQGSSLDNREGTVMAVDRDNRVTVSGELLNARGHIVSQQAVGIQAGALDNQNGIVSSQNGALDMRVSGRVNNQQGALEAAGPVRIDAGSLDNRAGSLLSAGDSLSVSTGQELNNQGGNIAAHQAVTLSAAGLNNIQGMVTAVSGALTINDGQRTDNTDGTLQSRGDLLLSATGLTNVRGTVQSTGGDSTLSIAGGLDNQQGSVSAGNRLAVDSAALDNRDGLLLAQYISLISQALVNRNGLIQGRDDLFINTRGQTLDNSNTNSDTTGLRSGGSLVLQTGDLNNQTGLIAGNTLAVSGQQVDNRQGLINSAADSQLTTGELNNQRGVIQSGGALSLDTRGAGVHNEQGSLLADKTLTLLAGVLNNAQGVIQGTGGLTLQGTSFDNTYGRTLSGAGLVAHVDRLSNEGGLLYATTDAQVTARQDIDNQQGLIKSGDSLVVNAAQIDNRNTRGDAQGIEAQGLTLNAAALNNQNGALRAGDALQANISGQLNNQNGLISSQNSLTLGQPDGRVLLSNGGGDIVANGDSRLWLGQLDGAGRITSGGSLSLDVASALAQDGSLSAGQDLNLNTGGNALTNTGSIHAGNQLTLNSGHLDNRQSGDINAAITHVNAADILNQGIIDGSDVLIRTGALHNTGTGRIYGDHLAIDARTLLNDKTGDTAATIAAREDLAIATDRLTNQDHGLIYSNGGLHIGGALNDAGELTGQASLVENLSATIEAMGDLRIDAAQTENRDIHLTVSEDLKNVSVSGNILEVELCSGEEWPEGCGRINGQHYRFNGHLINYEQGETSNVAFDFDQDGRSYALDAQGNRITVNINGQDEYIYLRQDTANGIIWFNLPGTTDAGRRFDVFSFTRSVKEQEVSGQDSAVIRSGGDLLINSNLHNKDSQVVAGQALTINGGVNNDETTIRQEIVDDGVVIRAGKRKEHKQTHFEGQGDYQPPLQQIDLPLHLAVQKEGAGAVDGRSTDPRQPTTGGGEQAHGLNGGAQLSHRDDAILVTEVTLPPGQSVNTQMKSVSDTLSDNTHHAQTDLPIRDGSGNGLADTRISDAGDLASTPRGDQSGSPGNTTITVPPVPGDWVLRSVSGPVKLPDSSLFVLHPGTDSHWLVETDPRFTREKKALSSGDFYSQDQLQKRLGDGYYEQMLVREQIVRATGQRYLSGYSDDEEQYRALLSSGKSFTGRFGITPGVDLTPEQMMQVTSDMVIMVNQTVTLPDGSTQVVSVPKLYARVQPGDLKGDGTLLSGNTVRINTASDVLNSGTIKGRDLTAISAGNLQNTGDISGNRTQLVAGGDIVNRGGQLKGGDQLILQAGHDIVNVTDSYQKGSEAWLGRQAVITVTNDKGELSAEAGHDIRLTASQLSNQGKDSTTHLVAGNDITLDTAGTRHATDYTRNSKNYDRSMETREVGSAIGVAGDLLMQSGHDINLRAADVTSGGDATLMASHDVNILSGVDTWDQSSRAKWTKHGTFSKTTTKIASEMHQNTAVSSTVSGDNVTVLSGNNLTSVGSNILGTHDVILGARNNLTLTTADESDHAFFSKSKKKSGISSTGGIGISAGSSSQKVTSDDLSNVKKGSVVGSSDGNLTLLSGNNVTVHGSDLVAGQDMTIQGRNVNITAAENSHTALTTRETKSSGLTLGLSGTVGSALNTATEQLKSARHEEDSRLAALRGTQAALTGWQAFQALQIAEGATNLKDGNYAGLTLSYGRQKSTSENRLEEGTVSPGRLQAGRDMTIRATDGDLNIQGSHLQAGRDMGLAASGDISMISGENRSQSSGRTSSHGGSVGAGVTVGSGSAGISVSASTSKSRGRENAASLTHTETTASAGRTLTLNSGRDTLLQGAQLSGETIMADVGRNLTITSEQDSERYDMKQSGSSLGGGATWGAGFSGSASVSASRDQMHSDFSSVQEQSGLFAGKGGFDVTVGNHTQLNGGVLASTATPDNNRLSTGTLGWRDIGNRADFETEHQGGGISSGGSYGSQFVGNMANNTLVGASGSGHDNSTTHAAVAAGNITIRDGDNQQQDVATLSRDTAHAANGLSPIFDKEKEQRRLQEAQLIGEIGTQVGDIVYTEGRLAAEKAKGDPEALATARKQLAAEGGAYTEEDVRARASLNAMRPYGTGSTMQQAISAATAAVQGLAGGNIGQAISGAAAPYMAEVIHRLTTTRDASGNEVVNTQANLMAHAVLGAVVASAQGNSALAGASGAVMGEYIGQQLYPDVPKDKLTEEQKQTIRALGMLAAGLAGGIAGDSTADAVAGAQAGKNAVENNALGDGWNNILPSGAIGYGQSVQSYVKYAQDNNLPPEQVQAGLAQMVKGDLPESADIIKAILSNNPGSDTVMALLSAEDAKDYALALLTSLPAEKALSLVGKGLKVIDNNILISAAEKISTAKPGKQFTAPRDLNEQIVWKQVQESPASGEKLLGMNNDPRFPVSAGFQKMQATHKLPDGSSVTIHYQYNSTTGKAYDMKIDSAQPKWPQPGVSLKDK